MRSVNKVILIGNVTRDPQLKVTTNGQPMTTFGIATNRQWITKDESKESLAEYHDVVAWARLAEICSEYLKKGKLVYVEGYLKTRSWEDETGVKKFRTEIIIHDMIMLNKKGDEEDYVEQMEGMGGDAPEMAEAKPEDDEDNVF